MKVSVNVGSEWLQISLKANDEIMVLKGNTGGRVLVIQDLVLVLVLVYSFHHWLNILTRHTGVYRLICQSSCVNHATNSELALVYKRQ